MPRATIGTLALVLLGLAAIDSSAQERGTKVIPERPARVFVMAGFDTGCKSITPVRITITSPPTQGQVTLRESQSTTVQYSVSGACIGSKVVGTGIYYTARPDAAGTDTFAIAAQIGAGEPVTRTFNVRIAAD